MIADIVYNHVKKIPEEVTIEKNTQFWFNNKGHYSVLSEYQLGNVKEVREHNYSVFNEYNMDGEIINEQEIIGDENFYIGFYTDIAYIQLYVPYRCDDFTIIRHRTSDKDDIPRQGKWNNDIKFIVFHSKEDRINAKVNFAFQNFLQDAFYLESSKYQKYKVIEEDFEDIEIIEDL